MTLSTTRTTANTAAEHVSDHNTAHGILNGLSGATGWGFPKTTDHPDVLAYVPLNNVGGCVYLRVIGSGTITKIGIYVGTQSGNISVGVCSGALGRANPDTRKGTSGAVACPAAGYQEIALTGSVDVVEGDWFAISADNTTAAFASAGGSSGVQLTDVGKGAMAYSSSAAHPIPASPTPTAARGSLLVLVGVA